MIFSELFVKFKRVLNFTTNIVSMRINKYQLLSVLLLLVHINAWAENFTKAEDFGKLDCSKLASKTDIELGLGIAISECDELERFYHSINPNNNPIKYLTYSVKNGHITSISGNSEKIGGILSSLNLPYLEELSIVYSDVQGSIPNFNLPKLKRLVLTSNKLMGQIPDFNLPELTELMLDENKLTGNLPNFTRLPNLKVINTAQGNQFTGEIPNFSNSPKLETIRIGSLPSSREEAISGKLIPSFEGSRIPDFKLPNLKELHITALAWTGNLPNFGLPNLEKLFILTGNSYVSSNGNIPSLNQLPNLKELFIEGGFSGDIPNFDKLSQLSRLGIIGSQFSGIIPSFEKTPNLIYLSIQGVHDSSHITGGIPSFSALRSVQELSLIGLNVTGTIPSFEALSNLTRLNLSSNQLTGNIPIFSKLQQLKFLSLNNNLLTGSVPDFNLPALKLVDLSWNLLGGALPNFKSLNLSNLSGFSIAYNCGFTPYDTTQTTLLNTKDSHWKDISASCGTSSSTQCATFNASRIPQLSVPCVNVSGTLYQAGLNRANTPSNVYKFNLDTATLKPLSNVVATPQCAVFPLPNTSKRLRLNCLMVDNVKYSADLDLTNAPNVVQFDLMSITK